MLPVSFLAIAFAYLAAGAAALAIRRPRLSRAVGFGAGAAASAPGLAITANGLLDGRTIRVPLPAPVAWAASELYLDGLSGFFLVVIFLVGLLSSVYAVG